METKTLKATDLDREIATILFSKGSEAEKRQNLEELIPRTQYTKSPQAFWDRVSAVSSRLDLMSDLFDKKPKPAEVKQSTKPSAIFYNSKFAKELEKIAYTLSIDPVALPAALNAFTSSLLTADTNLDIGGLKSPAITWNILVANSGDGKSRVLGSIQAFLALKQAVEEERYKAAKKAWDGYNEEVKAHNPEPTKANFYENTATIAALIKGLQGQNTGTLLVGDELIGFFGGLGRYGNKGMGDDDRAQLLSLWGGLPTRVRRVDESSSHTVNRPRLSLFGGMQPKIFKDKFIVNDVDGLSARCLPIVMESVRIKFMGMSKIRESNWECLINDYGNWLIENRNRFVDLRLDGNWKANNENPIFMRWTNFCHDIESLTIGCSNELTRAWLSKARDHMSRIMIPMHILKCYITERDGGTVTDPCLISEETLEESIRMFNVHKSFFLDLVKGDIKERVASKGGSTKDIVQAIMALCEEEDGFVTARDVVRRLNLARLEKVYDRKATELAHDILSVMIGKGMLKTEKIGKQLRFFIDPEYNKAPEAPESPEAPEAPESPESQIEAQPTSNLSLDTTSKDSTPEIIPNIIGECFGNSVTIDF